MTRSFVAVTLVLGAGASASALIALATQNINPRLDASTDQDQFDC